MQTLLASWIHVSTYPPILFKHLSHLCECPMQRTKSAAAQATDERPIAPSYLRQISVHPAFSSLGQKDDSQWALNPGCMVDDINPRLSTVSTVTHTVCGQALSGKRITPHVSSPFSLFRIAVLSCSSRLQYDAAFTVLPCS